MTNPSTTCMEAEEECWYLHKQVLESTEEDKMDIVNVFYSMAKTLATIDNDLAQEYTVIATKLRTIKAENMRDFLTIFLQPEKIQNMNSIRSFVYLKKISDQFSEDTVVLERKLAKKVILDMIHIIFYKTLPCPNGNHCKHYPRKIVHKNDFLDVELDCYFYHHEKDRRRIVLGEPEKEFKYAGNFADSKKGGSKGGFSQNFFESLYHPLYYKNFRCVRTKCKESVLCPYNHSLEEKNVWATAFKNFLGKDKEVFTKKRNSEEEKSQKFGGGKRFSGISARFGVHQRFSLLSTNSAK